MNEDGRAVCGLLCGDCPIYRSTFDTNAADLLLGWFKEMNVVGRNDGVEELMACGPYCKGCLGPRSTHWSPECSLLNCCVDQKGLTSCHLCDEFPCSDLKHWSAQDDKYADAYAYLQDMHSRIKE